MEKKSIFSKESFHRVLKITLVVLAVAAIIIGALSVGNHQKSESVKVRNNNITYFDYDYEESAAVKESTYSDSASSMKMAASGIGADYGTYSSGSASAEAYSNTIERKLIRSVSMTIYSSAYDEDYEAILKILADKSGYIEYSYKTGDAQNGKTRRANLTLRVPSARLDEFLKESQQIGRVTEISENTIDQTTQYYDNQTRLNTLRTKMTRLEELLAKAADVSDLIQIESEISNTQYEIDSYETVQRTIQNQVDMSEVSLTIREETIREKTQVKEKTLGERIAAAFETGWKEFVAFLGDLLVFLTMALPVIVVLTAVIIVIVVIRRKRKNAKKPEDHPETKE